uniref:Uncharacterized protein n=1 Tax=Arundo donax TaxID=35708 RepID=A0A0A8ZJ63_ARUDO
MVVYSVACSGVGSSAVVLYVGNFNAILGAMLEGW